jgi:hypothetical protein
MKIGSIMGNSILAVERQLQAALLKQRELKEAKEAAVRDCERIVNVIEGYRHALVLLENEANKI